jgi:SAM-dependent methyltransferase
VVDLGCAVGRTTFELAKALDRPVLGIDLNVGMLRLAARVLAEQEVCYPLRRVGMVYDQRKFEVSLDGLDQVDFWACDATCLPLGDQSVALAASLNVIDCLASPYDHLKELARILAAGGRAIISSPYDWNPGATPVEAWLGGHSQRSETGGQSDVILHSLLAGGGHPQTIESLELLEEIPNLPWQLRLHDRSLMQYQVHLLTAQKRGS